MRLCRFSTEGSAPRAGVVGNGAVHELAGSDDLLTHLDAGSRALVGEHDLSRVRLLTPVAAPRKFLAIGLNYRDHCAEVGLPEPDWPVFFNKQVTCIVGPGDACHVPRVSEMVDYEGELGVVIGRAARHVSAARAHEVIAGYVVVNDVTVRDWQLRAPTMTLGKSFDTHGPVGPWLVTPDEVGDTSALAIRTWVNDELLQDTNTDQMIFSIAQQIETLSTAFTLEPGDLIATGTGAGVGIARRPPRWLAAGDAMRVEIERVGVLENPVVAEPTDTARS